VPITCIEKILPLKNGFIKKTASIEKLLSFKKQLALKKYFHRRKKITEKNICIEFTLNAN